jgi:hypothetical protein
MGHRRQEPQLTNGAQTMTDSFPRPTLICCGLESLTSPELQYVRRFDVGSLSDLRPIRTEQHHKLVGRHRWHLDHVIGPVSHGISRDCDVSAIGER